MNDSTAAKFAKVLLLSLACGMLAWPLFSQYAKDSFDVKAHYEKHEYRITMRDGVKLFTEVYVPRDNSEDHPILLSRTPYSVGPYGPDAYRDALYPGEFARANYIFAMQDARGRYKSEGHFVHMTPHKDTTHGPSDVDESTDTYDTIDWLIKNIPHNNGRVGLWGISYPGFFAAAGIIGAHPALKAASPQAPQADWFAGDDTHHNGAFLLTSTFNFMAWCGRLGTGTSMSCGEGFDYGSLDGYSFFLNLGPLSNADAKYFRGQSPGWTEMMDHGTYDEFWQARNLLPHLQKISPAILAVGGWYDANNFYGALHVFESIQKQSPTTSDRIVIGPWSHGQWARGDGDSLGPLKFGSETSKFFRANIQFPFFEHYLRDKPDPNLPTAYVFETGANRWHKFESWPPKEVSSRSLYLQANGGVSFDSPNDNSGEVFDEYISDPAHPVPFVPSLSTDMDPDYMSQDQRFAATRPDVLVYQSDVLNENVTIAGPVAPELFVSSSGTDSDWIVKLIDVYPEGTPGIATASEGVRNADEKMFGFEELVRGDVVRAKFRNSLEKPEPLRPGEITRIDFTMTDVYHTFQKGHRIMIQVQSSWFPLVDRNPQKFVDIYHASAGDFQKATERVYRSPNHSSQVKIYVLPAGKE